MTDETIAQTMERSEEGTPSGETLIEVIAARRQLIHDEAQCQSCGVTRKACKDGWGTDGPEPEDLCCTVHCRHVDSQTALGKLIDEMVAGKVRTVAEVLASRPKRREREEGKPYGARDQFDQGEWWLQKSGAWIRVADMSPSHRYNTAAMLMRHAEAHAFNYGMMLAGEVSLHDGGEMAHESLERMVDEHAEKDSREWLRSTALYKALTAGLIVQGDGTESWQKAGYDPTTGLPLADEIPPRLPRVCEIPACGCSGEAHA